VEDAASFARTLFIEALRRAGVAVDASPLAAHPADRLPDRTAYEKLSRVALLTSPPFAESAKLILKVSHNLQASTLPLLVAAKNGKRTLQQGLRLQHDFLARAGVSVDTISFGGGAGGSRADYTTPRATVQLLRFMANRPDFAAYEDALPVLGVDGTLATVVKEDSPARGKVRAKTGTLFWENTMNARYLLTSKALAGYMTTSHGRKLAFAMFVNNTHLPKASDTTREGRILGKLCEVVYGIE
jgi:D-alanyl-D-alanine carboxypeptidase/D-alanyl-D-alanine-endopeptidase (penicillin-binding protein 4)